ncbi:IS66 family insertion sequence element accessory protein TnpB [Paenibacillus sp. J2TS4]|uniref:IS66 family insertion sequence element accessory protein TnpB n=1 Tax=Paenibacillus sp. J2TS4 TaxID=2807194 RepID=UPI001B1027C8|nr:IS66 family insertion sequence element accessory protein TnpB [Paenibacillus sp. J2TS4]GIP33999.1 hypothetical protein J2TS4_32090 [Paenibacillus sp. J2TS4]
MLPLPERVLLASGTTDLRKSIDGLAALVQESLGVSPFAPTQLVRHQLDNLHHQLLDIMP